MTDDEEAKRLSELRWKVMEAAQKDLAKCLCTPTDGRFIPALDKVFKKVDVTRVHPEDVDKYWLSWYVMPDGTVYETRHDHTDVKRLRGEVEGYPGDIGTFVRNTGAMRVNTSAGRRVGMQDQPERSKKQKLSIDLYCPATKKQLMTIAAFIKASRDRGFRTIIMAEAPNCAVGLPHDPEKERYIDSNAWEFEGTVNTIDLIPRFCRLLGHDDCPPEE